MTFYEQIVGLRVLDDLPGGAVALETDAPVLVLREDRAAARPAATQGTSSRSAWPRRRFA